MVRSPISVQVEHDGVAHGTRYPEEIEGAAYFFVCEGLANALKHASARNITVRLSCAPTTLKLEVGDDGCGFVSEEITSSGLQGLSDRIEALGGSLQMISHPGEGTSICATLPLKEYAAGV